MTTIDELWNDVSKTLDHAISICWDECHKIYVLLDEEQNAQMRSYGYATVRIGPEWGISTDEALVLLKGWWDESCFLRFISTIRTVDGDPNKGFGWLIEQGFDEDEDEGEDW